VDVEAVEAAEQAGEPVLRAGGQPREARRAREAHQEDALGEARRRTEQLHALGRAAHHPVHDDDVGGLRCARVTQDVGHAEGAPLRHARLGGQFGREGRVGGHQLDHLALGRTTLEQLGLEGAHPAPQLQHARARQVGGAQHRQHAPFGAVEAAALVAPEVPGGHARVEQLLAGRGPATPAHAIMLGPQPASQPPSAG